MVKSGGLTATTIVRDSNRIFQQLRVEEGRGIAFTTRFPSPLIKPDVRISRIRLSDWLHLAAVGGAPMCIRRSRSTPSFPKTTGSENRRVPREGILWRRVRNPRTDS